MLEEPVVRELLRVCEDIDGSRADIVDRRVEFLNLILGERVAVLLRVDLGVV